MTSFIEPDTAQLIVQLQIFAAQIISKVSKKKKKKKTETQKNDRREEGMQKVALNFTL